MDSNCNAHMLLGVGPTVGAWKTQEEPHLDYPSSRSHNIHSPSIKSKGGNVCLYCRIFTPGLVLYRSWEVDHTCCEFKNAVVLQCQKTVLLQSSPGFGSCRLWAPSSMLVPETWGEELILMSYLWLNTSQLLIFFHFFFN